MIIERVLAIVLACTLLMSSVSAFDDHSTASYLELDAQWLGRLTTQTGPDPRLSSLEARVTLIPDDTYETKPEARSENGTLIFEWDELRDEYEYSITSRVRTELTGGLAMSEPWPTRVRDDQPESELIDYEDPTVRAFASGIAAGETDTLRLAVRVAEAVRDEITYNLTSLNADATYPASEVLARGEGVCDEITVLYIATMRALGVPARYVSGYAFTNIFEPDGSWEGHGWAEVRIAGEWVPFDLTYAEYVQLSPTHLALRRSDNAESSSIKYAWYGNDVSLSAERIETDIRITEVGPSVSFGRLEAGFVHAEADGWNELEITVTNELDSFIAPILRFSRTRGLEHANEKVLIVPPRSSRAVRIPVEITEQLRPRYEYTFPVSVDARGFEPARAVFIASTRAPSYAEPEAEDDARRFHPDLSLECTDVLGRPGETTTSSCDLRNTGNRVLDVRICADSCERIRLLIGERRTLELPLELDAGVGEKTITVSGDATGEETIRTEGRAPAIVSVDAQAQQRTINIDVTSSRSMNGTISIAAGSHQITEPFGDVTTTVPSSAFGLFADATITITYEDVDGTHTIERSVRVEQNAIEWLATRIETLLALA